MCIVAYPEDPASDEADECVIPIFNEFSDADLSSLALKRQCDRQETDFVKTPSTGQKVGFTTSEHDA